MFRIEDPSMQSHNGRLGRGDGLAGAPPATSTRGRFPAPTRSVAPVLVVGSQSRCCGAGSTDRTGSLLPCHRASRSGCRRSPYIGTQRLKGATCGGAVCGGAGGFPLSANRPCTTEPAYFRSNRQCQLVDRSATLRSFGWRTPFVSSFTPR